MPLNWWPNSTARPNRRRCTVRLAGFGCVKHTSARLPARTHEDLQHAEGDADRQLGGLAQRGPPFNRQLQADDHQVAVLLDADRQRLVVRVDMVRHRLQRIAQRRLVAHQQAQRAQVRQSAAIPPGAGRKPVRARAGPPVPAGGRWRARGTFRSGSSRQRCGRPVSTSSARASRPHDAATSVKEVSTALRMRAVIGLKAAGGRVDASTLAGVSRNDKSISRSVKSERARSGRIST